MTNPKGSRKVRRHPPKESAHIGALLAVHPIVRDYVTQLLAKESLDAYLASDKAKDQQEEANQSPDTSQYDQTTYDFSQVNPTSDPLPATVAPSEPASPSLPDEPATPSETSPEKA